MIVAIGWIVAIVAWGWRAILAGSDTDNRPRLDAPGRPISKRRNWSPTVVSVFEVAR